MAGVLVGKGEVLGVPVELAGDLRVGAVVEVDLHQDLVMPQMSKVELYAAIRRDHRDSMKLREIERKCNVSWRTIRKAVDSVWPEPRKKLPPRPTAPDSYKAVIDGILRADLDAPRKQRHTVTRIFHRLVEEHGADVSYQQVRRYVADRKPQILVESGKTPLEVFVPQTHQPGMEAEVDFGDVTVREDRPPAPAHRRRDQPRPHRRPPHPDTPGPHQPLRSTSPRLAGTPARRGKMTRIPLSQQRPRVCARGRPGRG
ncbi:hypothetical protein [Streptomyces sp. LS1784]|uniref:hypothetical protein n=1 Tax=Streptomyces sp. LS1784 TaxID=2851533 RepID=UPI001CCD9B94|nr:hypothetical protein [Streptomyces sp. LS1784]